MTEPKQQREIAIFWDYENVPLPTWCSATQAAKAIVDAVSPYGRIVDRRLYYDFEKMNYRPRDCSSLDSSGFDLVNTPTRNNKETLDKKLIADVLTFAWDSAVRNDNMKPCVVLLTGDGDYAYTLSKLRDRGIMTVVMVGRDCTVASILVDTADVAMSLEDDVLRGIASSSLSTTIGPSKKSSRSTTCNANTENGEDHLMLSICRSVQSATELSEDGWADFGKIALQIQQTIRQTLKDAPPTVIKEQARAAREKAESNGYIEIGRRKLNTRGTRREIVVSNDSTLKLSSEVYTRLLPKGERLLQNTARPESPKNIVDDTNKATQQGRRRSVIYMPRLAFPTDVQDLVNFLEDTFHVAVRRARIETSNNTTMCHAHVEFFDEKDASVMLQAAHKSAGGQGIYFGGKSVGAIANTRSNAFASKGSVNIYYESEKLKAPSPRTRAPVKKDRNALQDDDSADTKTFCLSVYLAASKSGQEPVAADSWINSGVVGASFRSQVGYLKAISKEDVNSRFKQARNSAIQSGLVEMGRRELSKDNVYVAVALEGVGATLGNNLSRELYFRLLPSGQKMAIESQSTMPDSPLKSQPGQLIYMKNLPRSTTASQLAKYLETLEVQIQRVELKESTFKGSPVIAAHVECVDTKDASKILRKKPGLVFCGRSIYATPDRLTPDQVNRTNASTSNPDMSYIREENLGTASVTDIESTVMSLLSDVTGDDTELVTEDQIAVVDDINHIMRQDSTASDQKDPFEDLIAWT